MSRVQRTLFYFAALIVVLLVGNTSLTRWAQAQTDLSSDQSSGSANSYTLTGTVINSVTGEPVRRALVQFIATGSAQEQTSDHSSNNTASLGDRFSLTDREGHFHFPGLPHVRGTLSVVKPGFFNPQEVREMKESGFLQSPPEVRALAGGAKSVEVGTQTPAIVLKLIPEAVITGHVVDPRGEPLEGVAIKVSSVQRSNGHSQLLHFEQGPGEPRGLITNADGEYRMAGLIAGTYYVTAMPQQNRSQTDSGDAPSVAYPVTYYPGVSDFSQATPVQLPAGEQVQLDFTLKPVPIVLVTGAVTGYPRGQQPDLQFMNGSGDDISFDKKLDAYSGQFEAHVLAAGECHIKANAMDMAGHPLHGEVNLDIRQSAKNIVVALSPPPSIPINVQIESTQLVSGINGQGFQLNAAAGSIPAFVTLHPLDIGRATIDAGVEGGPASPILILRNVEPGEYSVEVMPSDSSSYVKSVMYGSVDLLRQNLLVTGGQYSSIDVVLRDDSATLRGSVQSDGTVKPGTVLIVPDSAPTRVRMATTDDQGSFQIDGVAPGDYKVFAFDHLDGLDYTNPDALGEYASKAVRTSLQPGEKATLKLELIARGDE